MSTIEDLLAGARLPERTVPVCLRGDLQATFDELQKKLEGTREPQMLYEGGDRRRIAQEMQDITDQMRSASVDFRLRAMSKAAWKALLAAHAPREGNDSDRALGFNPDTMLDAMTRACIVDPIMTDKQFELLQEKVSPGTASELENAAWALNRNGVSIPFSHAASVILGSSGETSKQPAS